MSFRFYLGVHKPAFMARTDVPLCISRRVLAPMKRLPRPAGSWVLDSGGFTELNMHGRWSIGEEEYAETVERFCADMGRPEWVAPMDLMCEPAVRARTGLTVEVHQEATILNFCELRQRLGHLVIPVVQGWETDDYLDCVRRYWRAGVDLSEERCVGVGSICRKHADGPILDVLRELRAEGLRMHAFGVRGRALARIAPELASADSLAWSSHARRRAPLPGHEHKNCANCLPYALMWRSWQLEAIRWGKWRSPRDPNLRLEEVAV